MSHDFYSLYRLNPQVSPITCCCGRYAAIFAMLWLVGVPSAAGEERVVDNRMSRAIVDRVWGPELQGLRLSVQMEETRLEIGQPIVVSIVVTNTSDTGVVIPELGGPEFENRFDLRNSKNLCVPFARLGKIFDRPPKIGSGKAAFVPAKAAFENILRIDSRFEIHSPGMYTLTVRRLFKVEADTLMPKEELISNTVRIEIIAANQEQSPREGK